MKSRPKKSAFAVISAPILFSEQLSDAEKIIFGHISNLCNERGYCYATNAYLVELCGKSLSTLKRALKRLTELNFIQIQHVSKGKLNERRILLSYFPNVGFLGGGSKMAHPQPKNEPPGGPKMGYRIIKEEYTKKTTTSSLQELALSETQKQKLYHEFTEEQILQGLKWLKSIGERNDVGAALYDAIKNNYQPKTSQEDLLIENKTYAQEKLGKYDNTTINGYKVDLLKDIVQFSPINGHAKCFDYLKPTFKQDLDQFTHQLGLFY